MRKNFICALKKYLCEKIKVLIYCAAKEGAVAILLSRSSRHSTTRFVIWPGKYPELLCDADSDQYIRKGQSTSKQGHVPPYFREQWITSVAYKESLNYKVRSNQTPIYYWHAPKRCHLWLRLLGALPLAYSASAPSCFHTRMGPCCCLQLFSLGSLLRRTHWNHARLWLPAWVRFAMLGPLQRLLALLCLVRVVRRLARLVQRFRWQLEASL